MHRELTAMNWIVLILFCASAPFVFVYLQALWANQLVPALIFAGLSSAPARFSFMLAFGCVGAAAAAALLSAPLARLVPLKPVILAAAISATTSLAVLVLVDTSWLASAVVASIAIAQHVTFFLVSFAVAAVVVRTWRTRA